MQCRGCSEPTRVNVIRRIIFLEESKQKGVLPSRFLPEAVVGLRGVEGEDARPLWLMWAAMTHPGPAGCCTKPPKKTAPVIRALRTAVASRSPIALENVARPEMQAWLAAPTRLLLALGALDPRQVADPVRGDLQ